MSSVPSTATGVAVATTPSSGAGLHPLTERQVRDNLATIAWWPAATPEQQQQLVRDYWYNCCDDAGPDVPEEEYLADLAEYPDAAEYLSGVLDGADAYPDLSQTQDATPAPEQAPAPTATLRQANHTLEAFERQLATMADANYRLGALAYQYVQEFLGAAPGKAQRSTAVENLADKWRLWDEESMAQPVRQAMERLRNKVNTLLAVHAVATLLGDGRGVPKGDGTKKGRGKGRKQESAPVSWSKLRELRNLVFRDETEYAETWHVLASVADKARQLVREMAASGMARANIVTQVRLLLLEDAGVELDAAVASGVAARIAEARKLYLAYWDQLKPVGDNPDVRPAPHPAAEINSPADAGKPADGKGKDAGKGDSKPAGENSKQPARGAAEEEGEEEGDGAPAGADKPAQDAGKPAGECRKENLLRAAHAATAKDAAGMLAVCVAQHDDPHAVLCELAQQLALAKHDTLTADAVLDALLTGLDLARLPGKAGRAVKAARLALAAKDSAAA